jgi:hypothetical protein
MHLLLPSSAVIDNSSANFVDNSFNLQLQIRYLNNHH